MSRAGFRLHLREVGPEGGEPAVFVHGLGGSATNWTDLMGLLSGAAGLGEVAATPLERANLVGVPVTPYPALRCLAVDLPGFGLSEPPGDGYSLDTHARAVRAVAAEASERADGAGVHLFGNSLGGAVALRLAATSPELVRTLTLVSPALPVLRPPPGTDPRVWLMAVPGMDRLVARRLALLTPEQRAWGVASLCYADPERVPAARRREAVEELARRAGLGYEQRAFAGSLRGLIRSYLATGASSLWRQAASVRAPVLLLWGRQDRLVPVALAGRALQAFRSARLEVFPDAGHVAQLEKPAATAAAVTAFLLETPPPGRG